MKLWRFHSVFDDKFALASCVGTWAKKGNPPEETRVQPMIIEWEPSSTVVGDFTWAGPGEYLVKRSVGEAILAAGFKGFELGPVEMKPNRDHKRRKRNMIQLPYEGPELSDWCVTKRVSLNMQRSSLQRVSKESNQPIYDLVGIERKEIGDWHPETGELEEIYIPRTPGMGLYVDADELDGCDVFSVTELGGFTAYTDRLRNFILKNNYTNISFLEVGEVFY